MGLKHSEGWPTEQALPSQFELLSADIIEANKFSGTKSSIHLWLRPDGNSQPRSYKMPYSRTLHKMLFETKQRIDLGHTQLGILYEEGVSGKGISIGSGKRLEFVDAPRNRLPAKRN